MAQPAILTLSSAYTLKILKFVKPNENMFFTNGESHDMNPEIARLLEQRNICLNFINSALIVTE